MLISVCIPHYNRSKYLLAVLESIRKQDYPNAEVIISDDCSTDDSSIVIPQYIAQNAKRCAIRFVYIRQSENLGYDGNLRAAMAAAHGEYLFILGNDDALAQDTTLSQLAYTLKNLGMPDVGFSNFHPFGIQEKIIHRAQRTKLLGFGPRLAVRSFRSFSFVGGIVFKQSAFRINDTNAYNGSIYVQIYLAARIIASGGTLASISEAMVTKDVQVPGEEINSYLDTLASDNVKFSPKTGGLDQVGKVACDAILPYVPRSHQGQYILSIYGQLYLYSYPFWLYDYRKNGVYRAAVNMALGCMPIKLLNTRSVPFKILALLFGVYLLSTATGLLVPIRLLTRLTNYFSKASRYIKDGN